jgi:hypothetical protein
MYTYQLLLRKIAPVVFGMMLLCSISYSQSPSKAETLTFLNSWMNPSVVFEVKGNNISVKTFDVANTMIKDDKAPMSELVVNPFIDVVTKQICIPCLKDAEGCVTRTMPVQKIKKPFNRITLEVNDDAMRNKVLKALTHLIRLESEVGYKEIVNFDAN